MVQRKAPQKLISQPSIKRSYAKPDRQPSSSSHQKEDTRNKGVGDLKKKMKLERCMRAAIDLPNYMKPTTSSWDKKKELVQVTTTTTTISKKLNSSKAPYFKKVRPLVTRSLKGVILNRPTCSSTLKDSKFPKALDLNHGGTEAEGISVLRVCPYTYCSLNGHRHDDLPPLKCLLSARRKWIKTQKSMELKALSSFIIKGLGRNKEENDTGEEGISKASACSDIALEDIFVEIYTSKPEQQEITNEIKTQTEDEEDDQMKVFYSKVKVDDDGYQSSEISNEEIYAMVSLLEYVECDQQVDNGEIEGTPILVPEEYEEPRVEIHVVDESSNDSGHMVQSENKASSLDFEDKEEIESQFSDNTAECFDVIEDDGVLTQDANQDIEGGEEDDDGDVVDDDDDISPHEELSVEPSTVPECVADGSNLEGNGKEELCRVDHLDQTSKEQDLDSSEENDQDKMNFQVFEQVVSERSEQSGFEEHRNMLKESIKEEGNENEVEDARSLITVHLFDAVQVDEEDEGDRIENPEDTQEFECNGQTEDASIAKLKVRLRIARKKITEESDAVREFNPRSPRFLDIEPDPEAETVDLRHQMMDERKNSEEYLIDYALQRVVSKLAPSRKKKVALLVEAFETVIPMPTYEKPLRHATSGFLNGRFMQACS